MKLHNTLIEGAIRFPRITMLIAVILVVALGSQMPRLKVDTDPENMLPAEQPARVFHNNAKELYNLHDMIVVGVVNEEHPEGVFNAASLGRIHEITRRIETIDGVVRHDLMSLASVDNITQGGPGVVKFEWMLPEPPANDEVAIEVRDASKRLPSIDGTLVSEDGRAAGIYVPVVAKSESHRIAGEIREIIADVGGDEQYFITGLPVAEDTFGIEMFKQMGISAPLAGLIIFLLMLFFFRSVALVTAPMIVAIATVVISMGLLIAMGFTVHIMSSMIPIFLMPIAVVDSIHILSEFADLYPRVKDRKKTIRLVMEDLFQPMLYTSLTSAAGFASLALAPIPPVRVFGVFVAFGIVLAFLLTVTFIPAYVVRLSDKRVAGLRREDGRDAKDTRLARIAAAIGASTLRLSKLYIIVTVAIVAVSAYGISKIQINDNPVRWFRPGHEIRVADRVLNEHFAGTYDAFLVFDKAETPEEKQKVYDAIEEVLPEVTGEDRAMPGEGVVAEWRSIVANVPAALDASWNAELQYLVDEAVDAYDDANDDDALVWEDVLIVLEDAQSEYKYFQSPEALAYIERMQTGLLETGLVGKSSSLVDIVKTVHRELREGDEGYFSIPGTSAAVAQTLLSYQSSHRPHDLWHFTTPDHRGANLWIQLKSGDNQDMVKVTDEVARYVEANPLPPGVTMGWAGLTYINVVWQDEMVGGMFSALLGSFVIVFIMMLVLFRNVWFGLLAMLPLSVTIAFVYGLIGLIGKDYDMPVAVLSSLTLGLSVDFAIHFLQRARAVYHETGNWRETVHLMFQEPARAITRNAIVISVGFLPLLASPLVPYNTVGFFLAAIMAVSSAVTLVLLPSVMTNMTRWIFRGHTPPEQEHELATDAGRKSIKAVSIGAVIVLGAAALITSIALAETTNATNASNEAGSGGAATEQAVARAATGVDAPATTAAPAADLTDVDAIIARANNVAYYGGDDGRSRVRMTVTNAKGQERKRQFTILRKDRTDGGDQDYAVLFERPADVRGTVFLVKKHVGSDDDRWLYLPDLDLVRRIAAGDKRTSFVGSHFFYEDVSGRRIDVDTHELVETTDEHYVLKNVPVPGESVEFTHWIAWIDKKTFLPVKMDYMDGDEAYRRIEALDVQEIAGHPTVTRMKVSDLRAGGFTVSEFRNVEYDLGIPDDVFTERTLRNPPRQWFKGK